MRMISYRAGFLSLLASILAFNYVDRLALSIVLQDIKVDLSLSDTQLGLVSGFGFAIFYSLLGIPLARWADNGNRVHMIAITTALWSLAVVSTGFVSGFAQLLAVRAVIAIGEAGCAPPAHSLISDNFPREERPRAMGRYMLGGPLSALIGYFGAGYLCEIYGWRTAFVILGIPGLMLATIAYLYLEEPRSSRAAQIGTPAGGVVIDKVSLSVALRDLLMSAPFRHLLYAFTISTFFVSGISVWQAAFFIRSHHLSVHEVGTYFALIYGFGGILGAYAGGEIAVRLAAGNEPLQLRIAALSCVVFAVFLTLTFSAGSVGMAFAFLSIAIVGMNIINAPLFATIQTVVPGRSRGTAVAVLYLSSNLLGAGLGPLVVGYFSDNLTATWGADALRITLLGLSPGFAWAAFHIWHAGRLMAKARATVTTAILPHLPLI